MQPTNEISEPTLDEQIEAVARVIYESGKANANFESALGTLKESVQLWKSHQGFHAATNGEMIVQKLKNMFNLPLDFMYVLSRVVNDIDDSIAQATAEAAQTLETEVQRAVEADRKRIRVDLYEGWKRKRGYEFGDRDCILTSDLLESLSTQNEEWVEFTKHDFYSGLDMLVGEDPVERRVKTFEKQMNGSQSLSPKKEGVAPQKEEA